MARKRASLKDKGEEILGVKRGGQGADILFGIGSQPESTPPEADEAPEDKAPAGEEGMPEGEADLDEMQSAEADAAEVDVPPPPAAEASVAEEGLPEGEADLDQELDLDSLLSAEAEAAEGEMGLPDLATTPAAPLPPLPEPAAAPPTADRPLPAPPPSIPSPPMPVDTLPSTVEKPAPAPAPIPTPSPVVVGPSPALPPASYAATLPPTADSPPPPAQAAPAVGPPSTATGAPDLSVPRPPRYINLVRDDFDMLAEETSADAAAAALVGAPESVRLTAERRAQLLRRRTVQDQLAELSRTIDSQYDRILRDNVSVNKDITDWCHNMLAEARTIVLHRQVERLAKAEWNVEQVRARLDRADESRKHANRLAWPITIWGVIWFAIFVYLIFNPMFISRFLPMAEDTDQFLFPQLFLRALFFGGIGGVAAVFYHLFKYMQQRSFDSQYALSYAAKPFMGMILGSMIYLTVFVLMRALRIVPSGISEGEVQTVTDVMYMALLFFIAMAAGFKENLAFDLLNRVIKAVLRSDREEEEVPPPSTVATEE
jgi:hypothetical protein